MEQKINITKYMIDTVKEVEKHWKPVRNLLLKSRTESLMEKLHLIGQQ